MVLRSAFVVVLVALVGVACGGSDTAAETPSDDQPAALESEPATTESQPDAEPAATTAPIEAAADLPEATATPAPEPTATAEPEPRVTLAVERLTPLGDGANYEVWLSDGESITSIGSFDSEPGSGTFVFPIGDPAFTPTQVQISIETDDDPRQSNSMVLAGTLAEGVADLTADHIADFGAVSGEYILATPTDGTGTPENERSGVWWTVIPRSQSLFLPELPPGWIYEGWQVIDGQYVTTGTFTIPFGSIDNAAPFSGPEPGPPLVGEDFLQNAPAGLTFPVDLRGTDLFISVEPVPDSGPSFNFLVPLRGTVPVDAIDHVAYPVAATPELRPAATATLTG